VLSPDEVLAADHFADRKTFRDAEVADGGERRAADGFFVLDGRRLALPGRAPRSAEHNRDTLVPIAKATRRLRTLRDADIHSPGCACWISESAASASKRPIVCRIRGRRNQNRDARTSRFHPRDIMALR